MVLLQQRRIDGASTHQEGQYQVKEAAQSMADHATERGDGTADQGAAAHRKIA